VIQPQQKTVQGVLNQTIQRVIKSPDFKTLGASKTDAGVHAVDQKVSLTCNFSPTNLQHFCQALNQALPTTIQINSLIRVEQPLNFHQQVESKTYLYQINDQS
jgi:tRNA pseudouridine38-40 synthase